MNSIGVWHRPNRPPATIYVGLADEALELIGHSKRDLARRSSARFRNGPRRQYFVDWLTKSAWRVPRSHVAQAPPRASSACLSHGPIRRRKKRRAGSSTEIGRAHV